MSINKNIILVLVLLAIAGTIMFLEKGKISPSLENGVSNEVPLPQFTETTTTSTAPQAVQTSKPKTAQERIAEKTKLYDRAKEIVDPAGFVNTDNKPITIADYVGKKVILLDIMTYSCINCIRTYPYLVDWYKKYEDKGLVIIGIHTPEFEFEKNIDNVRMAMNKYGIKFPVVLDNDYGTWKAYKNLYWPRKYLIDIDGFIRHDHIGEGGYEETEQIIQKLLQERAEVLGEKVNVTAGLTQESGPAVTPGQSPETYFGSSRNEFLGNGKPGVSGAQNFTVPVQTKTNNLYLGGEWNVMPEYAENSKTGGEIVYPFASKKVFLVMSASQPIKAEVTVDGKPLGMLKGEDIEEVNGKSLVTVSDSRLYSLYSGSEFGTHTIVVKPLTQGLKAFAFTFGN